MYIIVVPTQVEKKCDELANQNHCAVSFLSRTAVNLSWYDSIVYIFHLIFYTVFLYLVF